MTYSSDSRSSTRPAGCSCSSRLGDCWGVRDRCAACSTEQTRWNLSWQTWEQPSPTACTRQTHFLHHHAYTNEQLNYFTCCFRVYVCAHTNHRRIMPRTFLRLEVDKVWGFAKRCNVWKFLGKTKSPHWRCWGRSLQQHSTLVNTTIQQNKLSMRNIHNTLTLVSKRNTNPPGAKSRFVNFGTIVLVSDVSLRHMCTTVWQLLTLQ